MSTFNAEAFLGTSTKEALDTKLIPVTEGVHDGQIAKIEFRTLEAKDNNPERTIMELTWNILGDEMKAHTGMEQPTAKQSLWLDLTPESGLDLGRGKNIGLGKLREALGQNKPGRAWAPGHLNGGMAKVLIVHQASKDDPEVKYAQVKRVGNIST